jgi:Flp pilus assembly pilin Flp
MERGGIVRTRSTWVARSLLAIFAISVGVGLPLMVANGEFQQDAAQQTGLLLAFTAFMIVGAVYRPGNAVGWIFSAIGLLAGTGMLGWQYAQYAYPRCPFGSVQGALLGPSPLPHG